MAKGERACGSASRGPNAARLNPKTTKLKPGRDRVQACRGCGRKPNGDRTGLRVPESDANCIAGCLQPGHLPSGCREGNTGPEGVDESSQGWLLDADSLLRASKHKGQLTCNIAWQRWACNRRHRRVLGGPEILAPQFRVEEKHGITRNREDLFLSLAGAWALTPRHQGGP